MSLNAPALGLVKFVDPRIKVDNKRVYAVEQCPKFVNYQQYQPNTTTFSTGQQVTVSVTTPSPDVILNGKVWMQAQFSWEINTDSTGDLGLAVVPGQYFAPRNKPLMKVLSNVQVQMNATTVSTNPNQYFDAVQRYHNDLEIRDKVDSTSPAQLDQFQIYADWEIYGSNRNPLAFYGENANEDTRGGFSQLTVLTNTAAQATGTLTVCELVPVSPLKFQEYKNHSGFIGLQNLLFTFSFGNLNRIFSISDSYKIPSPVSNITTMSVSGTNFQLFTQFLTPPQTMTLPRSISYDYAQVIAYPTSSSSLTSLAAGANATVSVQNIQFDSIPRRVYLMCRDTDSAVDLTPISATSWTNTFARIQSVNITFNNVNGILAGAMPQDLYQIAVKNGCNLSWDQWNLYVGSPLMLNFGEDISLSDETLAPGVTGTFQFTANVVVQNVSSVARNLTFYVVAVFEGAFNIVNGQCTQQLGVVTSQDVMNAMAGAPEIPYAQTKHVFGGSFWDTLKDIGSTVVQNIPAAINLAKQVAPLFAAGMRKKSRRVSRRRGGIHSGGIISGGRRRSRKATRRHSSRRMSNRRRGGIASGGRRKSSRRSTRHRRAGVLVGAGMMTSAELRDARRQY